MCLAIPAQIVELLPSEMAKVRIGESETYITASTMLLENPAEIGDYVIVHAGFILNKLNKEEAEESLACLREIAQAAFDQPPNF